eukprot:Nk52_evm18s2356 gene=Nk52_evmTU18s2356
MALPLPGFLQEAAPSQGEGIKMATSCDVLRVTSGYANGGDGVSASEEAKRSAGEGMGTNGSLQCLPCGKTFKNVRERMNHDKTHVKCSFDQCSFSASKKCVEAHKVELHGMPDKRRGGDAPDKAASVNYAALFNIKLDTPEDIEKWRAERRKKYPTDANIAKKKEAEQDKKDAGVSAVPDFRYQDSTVSAGVGIKRKMTGTQGEGKAVKGRKCDGGGEKNKPSSVQPLGGLASIQSMYDSESESESETETESKRDGREVSENPLAKEDHARSKEGLPVAEELANALERDLGSLPMIEEAVPGVSSKDSADKNGKTAITSKKKKKFCKYFAAGKCLHGDMCKFSHDKKDAISKKNSKSSTNNNTNNTPSGVGNRPTLLRMLLKDEVQKDHNKIMQCLCYIVRENFFGIGEN